MVPRPKSSNLIEVLNTQALTDKISDRSSLSQNPDKSGMKLVNLPKAWQEWQEVVILTKAWQEWKVWNASYGLNSWPSGPNHNFEKTRPRPSDSTKWRQNIAPV